LIAEQASHLTVFQRTATYAVPAWNEPLDPERQAEVKRRYREVRAWNRASFTGFGALSVSDAPVRPMAEVPPEERIRLLDERWARGGLGFLGAFADTLANPDTNAFVAEYIRDKIREIVHDPEVAELLCPDQVVGCKRLCVDSGYYETFNRPNVRLVDIRPHGIEEITPTGLRA